jgi:EpsI family protein
MKNRYLWVIFLLLLLVLAVRAVSYDGEVSATEGLEAVSKIPHSFNGWQGTDYPLDPSVYDILETRSIIHRSYENSNSQKVFLSIVYYAETKVDFHAPEACLGGQGFKTTKSPDEVLINETGAETVLTVSKLVREKGPGDNELVYYFYKAGPFMGRSYLKLRLNLILNKFKDIPRSGSLIRVSTSIKNSLDDSLEKILLKKFINDLNPYIIRFL